MIELIAFEFLFVPLSVVANIYLQIQVSVIKSLQIEVFP